MDVLDHLHGIGLILVHHVVACAFLNSGFDTDLCRDALRFNLAPFDLERKPDIHWASFRILTIIILCWVAYIDLLIKQASIIRKETCIVFFFSIR